jgi:hypothetical protein
MTRTLNPLLPAADPGHAQKAKKAQTFAPRRDSQISILIGCNRYRDNFGCTSLCACSAATGCPFGFALHTIYGSALMHMLV